MSDFPIRINKYLAQEKIASRREADVLLAERKITINGKVAVIGQKVNEGDKVEVKGTTKKYVYLAYYKGRGIITHSPAAGEIDIATRLKKDYGLKDISPIGRLDKDSEGLIIISNDGRITGPLCDPDANHEKEYEVVVDKPITAIFTKMMALGVDIEGYKTKPAQIKTQPKNDKVFFLTITEGKKHQIRRMCAALGYQVQSLKRIRIENIKVGTLKPNQYRKITGDDLNTLLKSLGI